MKASRLTLFAFLIIVNVSLSWQKEDLLPTKDICRLFVDGTKLRKPGTCDEGIICQNFVSVPDVKCPEWYNLDTKACATKKPSDNYCKSPCSLKTSKTFVADKKNCSGWYQCNKSVEVSKGSCPANQVFSEKSQSCSYDNTCVATYEFCDVVPKNVIFQDEMNCAKYYMCTSKGLQSIACPTGQYYNKVTAECNAKATVDCYKHPYPDEVCGNTKIAYRNRFVSDEATCRGYFYCKDLGVGVPDNEPRWGQCPVFEFFNANEQACQLRSHVKCNEDRCDGRTAGEKEISGKKGCQHYLICGDGVTIEEKYCGDGLYFDAENSVCTSIKKSYTACS